MTGEAEAARSYRVEEAEADSYRAEGAEAECHLGAADRRELTHKAETEHQSLSDPFEDLRQPGSQVARGIEPKRTGFCGSAT